MPIQNSTEKTDLKTNKSKQISVAFIQGYHCECYRGVTRDDHDMVRWFKLQAE